jgi:hypothetical protein
MKTIKEVEKLAKNKTWCFEHVIFYLQKIIGLVYPVLRFLLPLFLSSPCLPGHR